MDVVALLLVGFTMVLFVQSLVDEKSEKRKPLFCILSIIDQVRACSQLMFGLRMEEETPMDTWLAVSPCTVTIRGLAPQRNLFGLNVRADR